MAHGPPCRARRKSWAQPGLKGHPPSHRETLPWSSNWQEQLSPLPIGPDQLHPALQRHKTLEASNLYLCYSTVKLPPSQQLRGKVRLLSSVPASTRVGSRLVIFLTAG